jgi:hypothetical protein
MPDLEHSLHGQDLNHLRSIAETWGLELTAPDARKAIPELVTLIFSAQRIEEELEILDTEARQALEDLAHNDGRITWKQFSRQYGDVRAMGPGRRDRLKPHQNPTSTAETLWYRALIGRAFFDAERGSEEFCYIPNDLLARIPKKESCADEKLYGRAATRAERAYVLLANDNLLDHTCTLLAARRIEREMPGFQPELVPFLLHVLTEAEVLNTEGQPELEATRAHLEVHRPEALLQLTQTWLKSSTHNDLHRVPQLEAEGEWQNDPLGARRLIIDLLQKLPQDTWWNLSAFVADIRQAQPDFQRPAGDYDSWYLKDAQSGEFLRGFEHWNDVDGALIRYLIRGPMYWLGMIDLGMIDLATPDEDQLHLKATAFRLSGWAADLLAGIAPEGISAESEAIHLRSNGRIGVPRLSPRSARYQIARFCHWEEPTPHEYRYRLTTDSLEHALSQGLQIKHFMTLLNKYAAPIPPNILTALKRWEQHGTEIRVGELVVLHVRSPKTLDTLRNSKAARFLGDPLGPSAITVKPGAEEKVLAVLLELGFLGNIETHHSK